jgi:NAD-dependent dihydropyrimidine dehydrogenase PreA subunit
VSDRENEPHAECSDVLGRVVPVIDRNRCEGNSACVEVCPYHVFELRTLATADRAGLSLVGKLKAWVHGGKQAYAVGAEDCHACGLCVAACPEQAIRLVPAQATR